MKPIKTDPRHCSHSTLCLRRTSKSLPSKTQLLLAMKLQTGFLLATVWFGWSSAVGANPYSTDWWSRGVATVRTLAFGAPPAPWYKDTAWRIEFDPEEGPRRSLDYQRYFGPRGENLIALLGSGEYRPRNSQMNGPL